ncbi:MAG: hypothetical protein Kow0031_27040 [Anaerolineae bacterium]
MPAQSPPRTDNSRPTQAAFQPVTAKTLLADVGLGILCLVGVALGLAEWYQPGLLDVQPASVDAQLMIGLLPCIFPVFVPAAVYFWWLAWRDWRKSRLFRRSRRVTTGVITHLWVEPPRPPGKVYYVGYRFGEGYGAYHTVHPRTYKRLAVGQAVAVEFAADNPDISFPNLKKRVK